MINPKFLERPRGAALPALSPLIRAGEAMLDGGELDTAIIAGRLLLTVDNDLAAAFCTEPNGLKDWLDAAAFDRSQKALAAKQIAEDRTERAANRAEAKAKAEPDEAKPRETAEPKHKREKVPYIGNASILVPVRKEEWLESEKYPSVWTNVSGEIMDGVSRKVRAVSVSYNPATRRYSKRVQPNEAVGRLYVDELLIERAKLIHREKQKRRSFEEVAT